MLSSRGQSHKMCTYTTHTSQPDTKVKPSRHIQNKKNPPVAAPDSHTPSRRRPAGPASPMNVHVCMDGWMDGGMRGLPINTYMYTCIHTCSYVFMHQQAPKHRKSPQTSTNHHPLLVMVSRNLYIYIHSYIDINSYLTRHVFVHVDQLHLVPPRRPRPRRGLLPPIEFHHRCYCGCCCRCAAARLGLVVPFAPFFPAPSLSPNTHDCPAVCVYTGGCMMEVCAVNVNAPNQQIIAPTHRSMHANDQSSNRLRRWVQSAQSQRQIDQATPPQSRINPSIASPLANSVHTAAAIPTGKK